MSNSSHSIESIKRTGDQSIDFRYYENRARCSRAQTALELFKMLFSDKHTSLDEAAGTCFHHQVTLTGPGRWPGPKSLSRKVT